MDQSSNEPLSFEQKNVMHIWLTSKDGEPFVRTIKEMYQNHLDLAQGMYLKLANPNEQIATQINQAVGIKEIIDFIDAIEREVAEKKKEVKKEQSEL